MFSFSTENHKFINIPQLNFENENIYKYPLKNNYKFPYRGRGVFKK